MKELAWVGAVHVRIATEPLSFKRLRYAVADPAAGAIVCFEGVTRKAPLLEYEVYAEMASERIARECAARHELCAIEQVGAGLRPLSRTRRGLLAGRPHARASGCTGEECKDRLRGDDGG